MKRNLTKFFVSINSLAILLSGAALADDRLDLEGNSIFGSRESPKALYVVPWRPLASGDIVGLQVETLLDEELEPIDPEAFRRQVEFYDVIHPTRNAASR